jgi:hypothetical protein
MMECSVRRGEGKRSQSYDRRIMIIQEQLKVPRSQDSYHDFLDFCWISEYKRRTLPRDLVIEVAVSELVIISEKARQ